MTTLVDRKPNLLFDSALKKKNCSVHTSLNILYAYINGAKAKSTFGYALKKIVVFTLV